MTEPDPTIPDCRHPKPEGCGLCEACAILMEHARQPEFCSCLCGAVKGAAEYGGTSTERSAIDRRVYLSMVAGNWLADAVRLHEAAGFDALFVEAELLSYYVYGPVHDGEHHATLDRAVALKAMRYDEYLRSPEWAEQRARAIYRAGDRCQGCNAEDNLEVHHRVYGDRGNEDLRDLTVLCAGCHTAVHLVADGRRGKVRKQSRRARV